MYYAFKLNLPPQTLNFYKNTENLDYLINDVVPSMLEVLFETNPINDYLIFEIFEDEMTKEELKKKEDFIISQFEILDDLTSKLSREYEIVLDRFYEKGEVFYPKSYIDLNDESQNMRYSIEQQLPILLSEYIQIYNKTKFDTIFPNHNYRIGTGITHLKKYHIMKNLVQDKGVSHFINQNRVIVYYHIESERFIISTENDDKAIYYSELLEKTINGSRSVRSKVGKININPIYSEFAIEGTITNITYTVVYPNGKNVPQDIDDVLIESKASRKTVQLQSEKSSPLNSAAVQKEIETEAGKGYLEDIDVSGGEGQIIKKIKSWLYLPFKGGL